MKLKKYLIMTLVTVLAVILIGLVKNEVKRQEGYQVRGEIKEQVKSEVTSIGIHPSVTYQGDTIFIQASQGGVVAFRGIKYELQPQGNNYVTLIPIPIDQKPGTYEILWHPIETMVFGNITAEEDIKKAKLTINKKEFSTQYLEVTKEQQSMVYNEKKIIDDRKKYDEAMAKPIKEPLFKDNFIQPVEGRISTMYGYTRYINGVLDSRHRAMDLAAPMGTPIVAPNNGKVVLAAELYLSGNRVILDHGGNLHTSFSHLSRLNVSTGDDVKKGEIIGWVGSTGFSTGPHLHHAVYVHGYPVNPEQYFGTNPYSW